MARVNIGNIWQEVRHRSRIFANRRGDGRERILQCLVYGHCSLAANRSVDIEEATITTTGAADNDGANDDKAADKLLKVESGWDMLKKKSHDSQNEEGPLTT